MEKPRPNENVIVVESCRESRKIVIVATKEVWKQIEYLSVNAYLDTLDRYTMYVSRLYDFDEALSYIMSFALDPQLEEIKPYEVLRKVRVECGLTQKALADLSGEMAQHEISLRELDYEELTVSELTHLLSVMGYWTRLFYWRKQDE